MNTQNDITVTTGNVNQVQFFSIGQEARTLMHLGLARGWDCAVLGQAPLPTHPVGVGDWLIVPAEQDTSEIPARAMTRIQAVFEAGIRPKGFVLVHEAPKLLTGPVGQTKLKPAPLISPELGAAAKDLAMGTIGVLSFGLSMLAAAASIVVPLVLLSGALLLDPILIAVTEDDIWIEIDRWAIKV